MVVSLLSNISSLGAQRRLRVTTAELGRTYERLASGQRINRASDDAAGLAVSSMLRVEQRILGTAIRNINDGLSTTGIMNATLENQKSILGRLSELATQAANGTLSNAQRATLQREYSAMVSEFGRLGDTTAFNGLQLLRGARGNAAGGISIQAGLRGDANSRISLPSIDLASLSGTIDLDSLNADFSGNGSFGSEDFQSFQEDGTATQLRERFGQRVIFLDGSKLSSGRGAAVVLFKSIADDSIVVIALEQMDDGRYAGDSNAFNDALSLFTTGGQISFDATTGAVTSVAALTSYGYDAGLGGATVDFNPSGFFFKSLPQGGSTALDFTGIETKSSALKALGVISNKIAELSGITGTLGATESRFFTALSVVTQARTAHEAAEAAITTADIAAESADLVRKQILQQAAISVLVQANRTPNIALRLLGT